MSFGPMMIPKHKEQQSKKVKQVVGHMHLETALSDLISLPCSQPGQTDRLQQATQETTLNLPALHLQPAK